jgi:hypothetical protein
MRRPAVSRLGVAGGCIQFRLIGDVADGACLSATAKQRALWALEHLDAFHVNHINVEVVGRKLQRLVIEIDRHVGK